MIITPTQNQLNNRLFEAILNNELNKIDILIEMGAEPNYSKFVCYTTYLARWELENYVENDIDNINDNDIINIIKKSGGHWHTGICAIEANEIDPNEKEGYINLHAVFGNSDYDDDIIDVISSDDNGISILIPQINHKLTINSNGQPVEKINDPENENKKKEETKIEWKHYQFRISDEKHHLKYKREICDANEMTMVMLAAYCGHNECLIKLIENGADVNIKNDYNKTALMYAIEENNFECMKTLLSSKAEYNNCDIIGITPLIFAVRRRQINIIEYLLKLGIDPNQQICEKTPTIPAIKDLTNYNPFENFMDKSVNVNDINIFNMLISHGADPTIISQKSKEHILFDIVRYHSEFHKIIFDKYIDKIDINHQNNDGETLLIRAADIINSIYYIEKIIAKKPDINIKTNNNKTALLVAIEKGKYNRYCDITLYKILLEAGANPNIRFNGIYSFPEGSTPLTIAVTKKATEFVKLLLKHGANPNIATDTGLYPLEIAKSKESMEEIIKLLEDFGAVKN